MRLLLLFLVLVGCGQAPQDPPPRLVPLWVDEQLQSVVARILGEAETAEVSQGFMFSVRSISVVPAYEDLPNVLGQCTVGQFDRFITIREDIVARPVVLELVMRHEMGHCVWDQPHDDSSLGVMNSSLGGGHLFRDGEEKLRIRPELITGHWNSIANGGFGQ